MRYHGNYCGPDWSAGKHQGSVISDVPALDDFDATCKVHDAAYASEADLESADYLFAAENLTLTQPKRLLAAVAVGGQAVSRSIDRLITNNIINMNKNNQRKSLRGSAPQQPNHSGVSMSTVPASYGFSLKLQPPKIIRSGNSSTIHGSDFAGTVQTANTSNYQPAASVLLNPSYYQNAMLGSLSRAFEKYRFTKAVVQYIPSVPTSTQGQLVMCSTRTVKEPFLNGSASSFLSRALSQGNAVATPLWREAELVVPCSKEWSNVDPLLDADLDDCIQEEVQCYAFAATTGSSGILMLHYEVEFKDPLFTFHSTIIPVPVGNGSFTTFQDNNNVKGVDDSMAVDNPSIALTDSGGTVYRAVFRQEASTLPTGVSTWADLASVNNTGASTNSDISTARTTIAMVTGTTLYITVVNGIFFWYDSYENAATGDRNGAIVHQTSTTAKGTYAFIIAMVRLGSSLRITSQ